MTRGGGLKCCRRLLTERGGISILLARLRLTGQEVSVDYGGKKRGGESGKC